MVICNPMPQADQFIHQSLTERNREAIQRFLEKEHPEEGECYLWVLDDVTMKVSGTQTTHLPISSGNFTENRRPFFR
jgi:hypothetical protein